MKKYACPCGYVYDEALGDPENGIPAGTKWEDLPENARRYVEYVEKAIGCHIGFVSVGAERDSLIIR